MFNKYSIFKWKYLKGASLTGRYDFPILQPCRDANPKNLMNLHQLIDEDKRSGKWLHFYTDDYRSECFWNNPQRYRKAIQSCDGVISCDYSMYLDMPNAQQIWNCWRNRVACYMLQKINPHTIPNACWSDNQSLEWAFDGLPEDSILAVTSQNCMTRDYVAKQTFLNGMHELVLQKKPRKIYVYGLFPEEWKIHFPIPIISLTTFAQNRFGGN